jgi:retron-type reverse transcriptase
MITYKNLFPEICKFNRLYVSYLKARKGKHRRDEVAKFTYNLERELLILQKELQRKTYKTGKYRKFVIFEPKRREISALPFRDRVVQHSICSVIEPIFEKRFIFDSYACRRGKGTHKGVERLQEFLKEYGKEGYALKCDISKYFQNINGDKLKEVLKKKIADKDLLEILENIIDSSKEGVPIGNLTSQLFANIYLNQLDEYVKYDLRIKHYIRYMDDFIMLHKSKEYLHEVRNKISLFLSEISLKMSPKKTNIFPVSIGVDFLGYRVFAMHRLARKSTVKRFVNKTKKKLREYNEDNMPNDKLMESFNSWEAYMGYGNTYLLKKSLYIRYFKNVV